MRSLAKEGVLPVWSQWWGEAAFEGLVPDEARRRQIENELPALPLHFFETPMVAPADWCARPCAFLLLSEFYRAEADKAVERGWRLVEHGGAHLDIATDETAIARALVELSDPR